jgi:hypothetical protein
LGGFCPYITVNEIGYIIEIFGDEEIKSSGSLSIDFGVCQPILNFSMGCVIVYEIVTVGEANLEKR